MRIRARKTALTRGAGCQRLSAAKTDRRGHCWAAGEAGPATGKQGKRPDGEASEEGKTERGDWAGGESRPTWLRRAKIKEGREKKSFSIF